MDDQLPPPVRLYQLATARYVSQAIYVAAALGIADLLADGPGGADELARSTGTHAASLGRVLRLLASAGVVRETADGTFDLTPVGSCLRSGPGSFLPSRSCSRALPCGLHGATCCAPSRRARRHGTDCSGSRSPTSRHTRRKARSSTRRWARLQKRWPSRSPRRTTSRRSGR